MSSHQSFQLSRRRIIVLTLMSIVSVVQVIWIFQSIFSSFSPTPKFPDDISQRYEVLARHTFNLAPNQCELGGINPYPVDHAIETSQSIILVCGNKLDGRVVSTFP